MGESGGMMSYLNKVCLIKEEYSVINTQSAIFIFVVVSQLNTLNV